MYINWKMAEGPMDVLKWNYNVRLTPSPEAGGSDQSLARSVFPFKSMFPLKIRCKICHGFIANFKCEHTLRVSPQVHLHLVPYFQDITRKDSDSSQTYSVPVLVTFQDMGSARSGHYTPSICHFNLPGFWICPELWPQIKPRPHCRAYMYVIMSGRQYGAGSAAASDRRVVIVCYAAIH